jgi:hypothetical protein
MDLGAAHEALIAALGRLRNTDGGWPYLRGRKSRLEPTCWAVLGTGVPAASTPLSQWATTNGLLADVAGSEPNFAFNALATMATAADGAHLAEPILAALVAARGEVVPASPSIRVDTSLAGWSWSNGTFSWVEPTAWCMLALKRSAADAPAKDVRIREAEKLMRDRACRGGGWNYGNSEVLGQGLAAYVPTTALGVLALQDRRDEPFVFEAIGFLERHALSELSTTALALSVLALAAVERPAQGIINALMAQVEVAVAFGNAAAIGMGAHALDCAIKGTPSPVLTIGRRPK